MREFAKVLSGGDRRSLGRVNEVISAVLTEPRRIDELFNCLFDDDEIVRMRAADGLEKICRQRPNWFKPYVKRLLDEVASIDQTSVQWHLAQMLGEVPLSVEEKKQAVALLFQNLTSDQDWLVLNFSLQSLAELAKTDSELKPRVVQELGKFRNIPLQSVATRSKRLLIFLAS